MLENEKTWEFDGQLTESELDFDWRYFKIDFSTRFFAICVQINIQSSFDCTIICKDDLNRI